MIVVGSEIVILLLAISVCTLAAWGIYAPNKLTKLTKGVTDHDRGIYFAVIVRLLLGLALIIAAPTSRFPLIFQTLGWIAIVAAVVLMFVGRERIRRLVSWVDQFSKAIIRLWLLFAIVFGGFLIYGISYSSV